MSTKPCLSSGAPEIKPLNIATTKPVALTTKESKEVKPNTIGVKMTPPPMPAITAIIAIATDKTKEARVTLRIEPREKNSLASIGSTIAMAK
tara:strand:- start:1063 stop:1338 length:276 start_codon:yes stop_codon:yes gene_type:complete